MFASLFVLAQTSIPEPDVGGLASLLVQAFASKDYTLVASVLLLAVVWAVRTFGAKFIPALGTPRAGAFLSAVGGTASLLVAALAAGQTFTLGLLFGCLNAALAASGLWSVAKNLATAAPICSAADIANKKPGCV